MSIQMHRAGLNETRAHALGFGLQYGHFVIPELDETRRQLRLNLGFWFWVITICLWREL